MTWISVVLVIAVGMFFLRDNIAKFINNATLQIAGETSNDGPNKYGFYFGKTYVDEYGQEVIFYEDGSAEYGGTNGNWTDPSGSLTYSSLSGDLDNGWSCGCAIFYDQSPDGKTLYTTDLREFKLKE